MPLDMICTINSFIGNNLFCYTTKECLHVTREQASNSLTARREGKSSLSSVRVSTDTTSGERGYHRDASGGEWSSAKLPALDLCRAPGKGHHHHPHPGSEWAVNDKKIERERERGRECRGGETIRLFPPHFASTLAVKIVMVMKWIFCWTAQRCFCDRRCRSRTAADVIDIQFPPLDALKGHFTPKSTPRIVDVDLLV